MSNNLSPSILNKKPQIHCLISAGPTREWIDPVRFISNPSSGKMGYALAKAAVELEMEVSLISGPVNLPVPHGVQLVRLETAHEMQEAIEAKFEQTDLIIMSAAVSDHSPSIRYDKKLKKDKFPEKIILKRNPDILKTLGRKKKKESDLGWLCC